MGCKHILCAGTTPVQVIRQSDELPTTEEIFHHAQTGSSDMLTCKIQGGPDPTLDEVAGGRGPAI